MRRYETIFIINLDGGEEKRKQILEKISGIVEEKKGAIVEIDEWGDRKLAYEIKKKNRGYYIRLDYCGDGNLVAELERTFRIDDAILKYMTILLDKDTNPEKIEAEKAEKDKNDESESAAVSNDDNKEKEE